MRSSARSDRLDLERGLPTTADDVEALRRAAAAGPRGLVDYLHFLAQLPAVPRDALRAKRGPRADRPFAIGWGRV